ncbi:alpha tubulin suppressor [Paecilomyces lecythidis]
MPLYAFGSNGSGQLGIGHVEDVSVPTRCLFDDDDEHHDASGGDGDEILQIAAGGNHTLVLFRSGAVYAAGCDEDGRCGGHDALAKGDGVGGSLLKLRRVVVEEEASDDGKKKKIERFKHVSATWEGTVLVSSLGEEEEGEERVFVMGSGAKGELGLGSQITRAEKAVRVSDFPPQGTSVVSMSSSVGHVAVVLSNGDVYGWGAARKGQLGGSVMDQKIVWAPVKMEGVPFRATDVACGKEFTVVTGNKERGEFVILGPTGPDRWQILSDAPQPADVAGLSLVAASWNGIYVHGSDGSVRAWGRNDKGQLPPPGLPRSSKIAVGSEHALALLDDQKVVAFGWGEHGNCGPETDAKGNVNGRWNEIPLSVKDGARVVGLGAGCATSWIIVS